MKHKLGELHTGVSFYFKAQFPDAVFESDGFEYAYDLFHGARLHPNYHYGIFTSNDCRYAYAKLPFTETYLYAEILLK